MLNTAYIDQFLFLPPITENRSATSTTTNVQGYKKCRFGPLGTDSRFRWGSYTFSALARIFHQVDLVQKAIVPIFTFTEAILSFTRRLAD